MYVLGALELDIWGFCVKNVIFCILDWWTSLEANKMSNQTYFSLRGSLKRTRKRTVRLEVRLSELHLDNIP